VVDGSVVCIHRNNSYLGEIMIRDLISLVFIFAVVFGLIVYVSMTAPVMP